MLKIEDLKVGDELVCIDRDGYADYCRSEERCTPIDTENLIYSKFYNPSAYAVTNNGNIYQDTFKFFKKKEQSQQYTFDDLIDVAKKAKNDGIINSMTLIFKDEHNDSYVDWGASENEIKQEIDYIQSLYKETFVIETEEDLDRFNKDVEITLANDEKLSWEDLKSIGLMNTHAIFKALKGATVTQSK